MQCRPGISWTSPRKRILKTGNANPLNQSQVPPSRKRRLMLHVASPLSEWRVLISESKPIYKIPVNAGASTPLFQFQHFCRFGSTSRFPLSLIPINFRLYFIMTIVSSFQRLHSGQNQPFQSIHIKRVLLQT